eukprot:g27669.t1
MPARKLPAGPERHEQTTEVKPVDRLKAADLERWDAEHQSLVHQARSVPRCPDEVTFQLDPGLEEEKNVLEAIYGPEFEALGPSEWRTGRRGGGQAGYPTLEPPVPIFDYEGASEGLRHAMAEAICELTDAWEPAEGGCVYQWVERLRESLEPALAVDTAQQEELDAGYAAALQVAEGDAVAAAERRQRRRTFDESSFQAANAVEIKRGEPFTDRKSTFQAFAAKVSHQGQVNWVLRSLLEDRKIAVATHNIFAYRFRDEVRGIQDGAGSKLAELLQLSDSEDVLVMVSRWYGGIHLGGAANALGGHHMRWSSLEPSHAVLEEVFGTEDTAAQWREVNQALHEEHSRKWHPMKTMVTTPEGRKIKVRGCAARWFEAGLEGLWDQVDLTVLAEKGWQLDGVKVENASTLEGAKTFLGVIQQFLDQERAGRLYAAVQKVHVNSRTWEVRGQRILERLRQQEPTLVAFQEYDVHGLATGDWGSFREALEGLGYEGADRMWPCGLESGSLGNVDLQEPLERAMDRRPFCYAKLLVDDVPLFFCGTHLMTSSRDKDGQIRKQETRVELGGGEHIFEGTGHQRDEETQVGRLCWRKLGGVALVLRDAYAEDYIFYEEEAFRLLERSELRCPAEAMPNAQEPSDHIPLMVTLERTS